MLLSAVAMQAEVSVSGPPIPVRTSAAPPREGSSIGSFLVQEASHSLGVMSSGGARTPWSCHGLRSLGTPACGGPGAGPAAPYPSVASPGWHPIKANSPPPQAAYDFEMTYDGADGYVLLLGAEAGTYGSQGPTDVWTFSAGTWTQLHPHPHPQNCEGSQLGYDDADGYVLYFGGPNTGYPGTTCTSANQTWTYKGGAWTQLHPAVSPPGRFGSAMTNDSADHYLLLFGGFNSSSGRLFSDTWTFKAGTWTKLTPKRSPSQRYEAGIAYDVADGYVLLFGGVDGSTGPPGLNDTWNFSGGNWTQLHPKLSPPGPEPDAFSYDAADRVVVYTTAQNWSATIPEVTWTFHAGKWSRVTGPSPVERLSAETAYDYVGGYLLFFGGLQYANLADSWTFVGGHWTNISHPPPSPRTGAVMAYDPADGYVVLFGGNEGSAVLNDTWTFSGGIWNQLHLALSPPAREQSTMAYDPVARALLLFGGGDPAAPNLLHDTWRFSGGLWTHLLPSPHPSARESAAMTYDAKDGYLLLFGGIVFDPASRSYLTVNDTWGFQRGIWTNITPVHSPSARGWAGLAYDGKDGYAVLFGGSGTGVFGDTWKFVGGAWTNLSPTVAPPARYQSGLVFDGRLGYLVLFGGAGPTGPGGLNDTWTFLAGSWTNVTGAQGPPARGLASLAYDAHDHFALLFGGGWSAPYSTAWKFV